MISKTIVFRGTLFSDKPISDRPSHRECPILLVEAQADEALLFAEPERPRTERTTCMPWRKET